MSDCYPWFHQVFAPLANESWTKAIIPSGCSADYTGSIPCAPESMRASAEAWLARNAPSALAAIGGQLSLDTYTFARYMYSEVGSGTIEERIAVGEAAVNQAKARAGLLGNWRSKLAGMLTPNGKYGAIHAPDAYCASIGMGPGCNAAKRWAATSRDPSVMSLLLANLVVNGESGDFNLGAQTQWGPEYLKNTDGSRMGQGTTRARIESFVRYAASDSGGRYYWVGPLVGVDPWHTWLAVKGPSTKMLGSEELIQRGIEGLPIDSRGMPIRPKWPTNLPLCDKPAGKSQMLFLAMVGLSLGALAGRWAARRYLHSA